MSTDFNVKNLDQQALAQVFQFLAKNNLSGTKDILIKELGIADSEALSTAPIDADSPQTANSPRVSAASAALTDQSASQRQSYEVLCDAYQELVNFIDNLSDEWRRQLQLVLFPVYTSVYLLLLESGQEDEAGKFFDQFLPVQELDLRPYAYQIGIATRRSHLKLLTLLMNIAKIKFCTRISSALLAKINTLKHDKRTMYTWKILNVFVDFNVHEDTMATWQLAGAFYGINKVEMHKHTIFCGLPKELAAAAAGDETADGKDDDEKPQKRKKAKKEAQSLRKMRSTDSDIPPANRVPLPELTDIELVELADAQRDFGRLAPVSALDLPSVCFYTLLNADQEATVIDISESSQLLTAGFSSGAVNVWSLTTHKLRTLLPTDMLNRLQRDAPDMLDQVFDDNTCSDVRTLYGHQGPVYGCSMSMDRTQLITCSEDTTIRLWNLHVWSNLVVFRAHCYPVWDVEFSPIGHYFCSGGMDNVARLWSTGHQQPLRLFAGHLADVNCVAFHPNCNYVATGSEDQTVRVWDVLDGRCVRILTGHRAGVSRVRFSPDGRLLASASHDGRVRLWTLSSGGLAAIFNAHKAAVYSLQFSRDSTTLASGGADCSIKFWSLDGLAGDDLKIVDPFCSYQTKSTPVSHVHFTRRNLVLAAGAFSPR